MAAEGREVALFDPAVGSWNEQMTSEEFAVHGTDGAANCRVFSSLEQAESFARQQVALRPDLRARIYGHEGFIGAPVGQLTGASFKGERDLSPRVRRWLGIGFLVVGSGLVVWDWEYGLQDGVARRARFAFIDSGCDGIPDLVDGAPTRQARDDELMMSKLLIEMVVVLLTALLCGGISRRLGQSRVIGEIIGGIMLGPSVFCRFAPGAWTWMFPPSSLNAFDVLSTVGLVLFLFVVGTQLDFEHLRQQRRTAAVASATSIGLPLALALLMAPALRERFGTSMIVRPSAFWLFLGVSLSITAFPVLARILEEQGLAKTPLGTAALMCAALDDVCAWLLLAVALTLLPHNTGHDMRIGVRLLWLLGYAIFMLWPLRRAGQWAVRRARKAGRRLEPEGAGYELLGMTVALVLASAAATEAIGVHPLFGAFLAGVCFPRVPAWQREIRSRLGVTVSVLLLPFFFALTGMRTRLDLLSGIHIWLWTAAIVGCAVLGKVGGAAAAAKLMGMPSKSAWALGALLNTRGLVELIVLNIAYNAHVFSPTLFTMLVVMALLTTMMTMPVLHWLGVKPGADVSKVQEETVAVG